MFVLKCISAYDVIVSLSHPNHDERSSESEIWPSFPSLSSKFSCVVYFVFLSSLHLWVKWIGGQVDGCENNVCFEYVCIYIYCWTVTMRHTSMLGYSFIQGIFSVAGLPSSALQIIIDRCSKTEQREKRYVYINTYMLICWHTCMN